jgi:hypothetical protein
VVDLPDVSVLEDTAGGFGSAGSAVVGFWLSGGRATDVPWFSSAFCAFSAARSEQPRANADPSSAMAIQRFLIW